MKEWIMIVCMTSGGTLFSIGGTGYKWARRFILPVLLALIGAISGVLWWKCLILCLGLIGALHLGYGQKVPYWGKFLVGCAFVAPTLVLGLTVWQIITPVAWIGMFWLSNQIWSSSQFKWKVVEFLTGTLIGVIIATLIG